MTSYVLPASTLTSGSFEVITMRQAENLIPLDILKTHNLLPVRRVQLHSSFAHVQPHGAVLQDLRDCRPPGESMLVRWLAILVHPDTLLKISDVKDTMVTCPSELRVIYPRGIRLTSLRGLGLLAPGN